MFYSFCASKTQNKKRKNKINIDNSSVCIDSEKMSKTDSCKYKLIKDNFDVYLNKSLESKENAFDLNEQKYLQKSTLESELKRVRRKQIQKQKSTKRKKLSIELNDASDSDENNEHDLPLLCNNSEFCDKIVDLNNDLDILDHTNDTLDETMFNLINKYSNFGQMNILNGNAIKRTANGSFDSNQNLNNHKSTECEYDFIFRYSIEIFVPFSIFVA